MKCLFISELPNLGGGETSLLNLIINFKKHNKVTPILLCFEEGELASEARKRKIEVYIYNINKAIKKGNIWSVRNYIKGIIYENNIKLIQTNEWKTSIIFKIILKSVFENKCRCIWICHGQWYKFNKFKATIINLMIDKIICVSEVVKINLISNNISKINIIKIPLGIDNNLFKLADGKIFRQEIKALEEEIVIGCIGRFQEIKGQKLLIESINVLNRQNFNFKVVFVGDSIFNNEKDDLYKRECLELIEHNNLLDKCIFLGARNDIPDILRGIDILVSPSINESFGMVLIEALASNALIIATPSDGAKEIIKNNENGILLYERSLDELVDNLKKAINKEFNIDYIIKNMKISSNKYSIEEVSNRYLAVYKEVIENRN